MVLVGALLVTRAALACSPVLPLKTLAQNVASADSVYLAKLETLQRTPLPNDPDMKYSALETATFRVLQTVKGKLPKDGMVRTRTEYTGGNCALSLLVPYLEVKDGKVVPPKLSGTWLLVLSGKEPYWLGSLSGSWPEESIPRAELESLLKPVGNVSGGK
jgi:hypothetical protein